MKKITKICTKCFKEKPLDEYFYCKIGVLQRCSRCKECYSKQRKENYHKNIEKSRREIREAYKRRTPEAKKRNNLLAKISYHKDIEESRKKETVYRNKNKDRISKYKKDWDKNNRDKVLDYNKKRCLKNKLLKLKVK